MRRALLALLAGSMSFFASAQLVLKDDHPTQYQVKKGDTLWDISATFLQSPWLWPRLWQANPDIDNPHLIYPGDILRLIWVDGEPRLTRKPVKKLSPTAKIVELKPVSAADDTLLLPFLNQDILVDNKELAELPKVIGASSGRIYLSSSDDVYVNKVLDGRTSWRIYRLGPQFTRSDKTEEGEEKATPEIMTSLVLVAEANVSGESDGISLLRLTSQKREIQPNDIVLPVMIPGTAGRFAPTPAPKKTDASILGHPYGSKYIGLDQVVVLDRGRDDGLVPGHTLLLSEPGAKVRDKDGEYSYGEAASRSDEETITLPDVKVGSMMVIRAYAKFSLALVMEATTPVHAGMVLKTPNSESS